jgi:hypothetical protein
MVEEHPNLCESHDDCMKKGSGSFCACFPNLDIQYGWCLASISKKTLLENDRMHLAIYYLIFFCFPPSDS